ncbi:MAG: hypothetical protein HDS58_00920 [Barnesiella sp.]|nr:hypothetical protein [Barnesiella sp.]MBD5248637.1 hypothetical protein [Barnesiella sp.]
MKECPHCGAIIDDELRYCPKCGIRIDQSIHVKTSAKKRGAIIIISVVLFLALVIGIGIYRFFATTYLDVEQSSLSFVKSGGTMKIPIDYDGYTWGVSHAPEWVNALPHGDTLYVDVAPNLSGETRADSIVIRSGTFKVDIPVSQNNAAGYIEVLTPKMSAAGSGQALQIDYLTDGAAPQIILPEYCHVNTLAPGKIMVSIDKNDTGKKRTAKIQLIEDGANCNVVIEQPTDTITEPAEK